MNNNSSTASTLTTHTDGGRRLVFATNNNHKLTEIRQILHGTGIEILSLSDIKHYEDIPETGDTLDSNATQKARYIKEKYGYDCFADDTGLEVDCLNGAPGIYSARYASLFSGEESDHDSMENIKWLLRNMDGHDDRTARFRTAICLIINGEEHLFHGTVEGKILTSLHGTDGFGYDPIFQPDEGDGKTFAEMSPDEKNAISHRGRATRALCDFLTKM